MADVSGPVSLGGRLPRRERRGRWRHLNGPLSEESVLLVQLKNVWFLESLPTMDFLNMLLGFNPW